MGINYEEFQEVSAVALDNLAEARTLIDKEFVTPWFQMDESKSNEFEYSTYLDVSPNRYAEVAYGDGLIEGFHLLGMLDYLCNHGIYCTQSDWVAWNYGVDNARFVTVTRLSDEFRLRGKVEDVVDRGEQGQLLVLNIVGEVRGRDKPGFVVTFRVLWTTSK